ncbi:hypothetical protein [Trebonia sp.]|uniref:hypothetical protein n=1 Tax=Trebonia sp. TaxID=2767075 RepID=UPI0026216768|nr:hypothetical protein [Trebonia sp.]
MTAAAVETARCACCEDVRPVAGLYSPYAGVLRCRDLAACERRKILTFDPTLMLRPDEDPVPPPPSAPAGTVCAACATPGDLYNRGTGWFHRDRAVCERALAEDYAPQAPDAWDPSLQITSADMRAMTAAARPEAGAAPVPLSHEEIAARAVVDALGRRPAPDPLDPAERAVLRWQARSGAGPR